MTYRLTTLLALTIALSSSISLAAQERHDDTITIRVYNFAGTSSADVARAQDGADAIFAHSNLHLVWLDCTLSVERRPADSNCGEVSGPSVLNLRLAPETMAPKQGLPDGIFGFSMMSTTGGFSSITNVYVERIQAIADGRKYQYADLLGAVISHELGHLLLGIGSHSKRGLMSLPWGPKSLTAANRGTLVFSERETKHLETAVAHRTSASI